MLLLDTDSALNLSSEINEKLKIRAKSASKIGCGFGADQLKKTVPSSIGLA